MYCLHPQELSSDPGPDANSLSRRLCHTILSNVDVSGVPELEARVWQPCKNLVEENLGQEVAGGSQRGCILQNKEVAGGSQRGCIFQNKEVAGGSQRGCILQNRPASCARS